MKFFKVSLFLLIILVLNACKNDLKLNAPYKEIPSIYAVLNPQEEIHMIRVNKVFLGEGDANKMAKVADSINYQPGELTITLKHSSNPAIIAFTESLVTANAGAFNTTQRVYINSDKLEKSGTYTLSVKNNHTQNVFTSTTTAIDKISSSQNTKIFSAPFFPYPTPSDPADYVDYSVLKPKFPYEVRYTPNDAKVYQTVIRMHFYDSLLDGNKTYNYVDFAGTNIEKKEKSFISTTFTGSDIFNAAGVGLARLNLNSSNLVGRKMYKIEYIIHSSTQDYLDYLQFSSPSLSISQNQSLYSNFTNNAALGIFTFRTTFSMTKEMSTTFIYAFSGNSSTCKYQFLNSALKAGTCP